MRHFTVDKNKVTKQNDSWYYVEFSKKNGLWIPKDECGTIGIRLSIPEWIIARAYTKRFIRSLLDDGTLVLEG